MITLSADYFLFYGLLSGSIIYYLTYSSILLVPILYNYYVGNSWNKNFTNRFSLIYITLIMYVMFMAFHGILRLDYRNYYLTDISSYIVFLLFIPIGGIKLFWEDLLKVGLPILIIAVAINMAGTLVLRPTYQVQTNNLLEYTGADRLSRNVLSYHTQFSMALWPIFFLTAYSKSKKFFLLVMGSFFFILVQQILFQKRGPSVRILTYLATFIFIIPLFINRKSIKRVFRRKMFLGVLACFILLALIIIYAPTELLSNQIGGLMDRLNGKVLHSNKEYSHGFLSVFTLENERVFEIVQMLQDTSPHEIFLGKGFGGYFKEYMYFKIDKNSLHIGWANLLLKGGLFLLLIYGSLVMYALSCIRYIRGNIIGITCFFYLFIASIFQLMEGWFYYSSNSYETMIYAASIGYLVHLKKENKMKYFNNV